MTKWTRSWDTLLFSGIALLIVLGLGGSFLAYYLNPVNAEMRRLQGDWELVRVEHDGEEINAGFFEGTYRVRGDRVTNIAAQESPSEGEKYFRIRVNPQVEPREIDLIFQVPKKKEEGITLAIYELEHDSLKICSYFLKDDSPRPTDFDAKSEGCFVAFFNRKK